MLSFGSNDTHDRDTCACGCGNLARPGLQPRFAGGSCRQRWIDKLAIHDQAPPEALDDGPQQPPPSAAPVPVEEVAEVQTEFAQRVTVAPQLEETLTRTSAPSGMWVPPGPGALWKLLTRRRRKVQ